MSRTTMETAVVGLIILTFIISGMNVLALSGVQKEVENNQQNSNALAGSSSNPVTLPTTAPAVAKLNVLPQGVPTLYGEELKVSFSDVSIQNPQLADQTIQKLAVLDQSIELEGEAKERYTRITNAISCEYCCGAPAITDAQGNAACGCAHSFAMRGLAKYLLQQHADEYTDIQILEELGKWKTLFFPDNEGIKAAALQANGIEVNYVNIASNAYRGLEQQRSSGGNGTNMVGGC